jgi:hypothetical protein
MAINPDNLFGSIKNIFYIGVNDRDGKSRLRSFNLNHTRKGETDKREYNQGRAYITVVNAVYATIITKV